MKKILYIHNADYSFLGANKLQVINMCNGFSKLSSIKLISFKSKDLFFKIDQNENIEYYFLKPFKNYYFNSLRLLFNYFKLKENYDLIYTRDIFNAYILSFFNKNVIYEIHEIRENFLWVFLLKLIKKRVFKIIAISKGLKRELILKKINKEKILVLPDAIDNLKFNNDVKKTNLNKEFKINKNKKIIMYVGSFQEWKGYVTLINASKYLDKTKFQLILIGAKKEEIEKLNQLYPHIVFKEFISQDKIPSYLKAADLLIIPNSKKTKISSNYTSPLKLFEYMSMKKPIIASNLPSIKEIVSEKEVLFFSPDNSKDLAKKIILLSENQQLQTFLSKNAFNKVKMNTWEIRAKKIINLK